MATDALRYEYVAPFDPSRVDHVGTYKRTLPVTLERMYENALDWEHLPYQHSSSFSAIDCVDSGAWGWRAKVTDRKGQDSLLELRLDRDCRRWITRNLEGPSVGAEIWTHVFVTAADRLDLVIDFFVPGVPVLAREKVGRAYARAYETLYDEDVEMMTERQRQLDRRLDSVRDDGSITLPLTELAALPVSVQVSGRDFFVNRHNDAWVVYPAACPHQLGPLDGPLNDAGAVTCPWHGYQFDVRTGECTTGANCRFGKTPSITQVDNQQLILSWPT